MTITIIISILINLIFAPIGCLVLWKRYVYFSDGLAHATMLASVLSVMFGVPILYAGILNSLLFALIVFKLKKHSENNASIGLVSSFMLSVALILSYLVPEKFNFSSLLFGDIITAGNNDAIILCFILAAVILFFMGTYRRLLLMILSKDVAQSRGIWINSLEFLFLTILSFSVLVTIKMVGALLVTSLILIPAMIARLFSTSPVMMIICAIIIAQIMNFFGIMFSYHTDMPFAPITIISGGFIYIISFCIKIVARKCTNSKSNFAN